MSRILDHLEGELAAERKVYLHCWGGVGRTGTVVGCHLVRGRRSGDEALALLAQLWQGMSAEKRLDFPESPQTAEQREFVRSWNGVGRS
jgi:protein-tyrosine phosphatase